MERKLKSNSFYSMKAGLLVLLGGALIACSSAHRVNGWYPVADTPENKIEGKAIVTMKDFSMVTLDTVSSATPMIVGKVKPEFVQKWTDATESRIGKRIGFVYNDSVIMAPTVNCRIESGSFSINSEDKNLILEIYSSLKNNLSVK